MTNRFQDLVDRWGTAVPSERANFQLYLTELCDALDVERPRPAGTGYEFEFPVKVVSGRGQESTNFIDLYKAGHFVLEAKDQERDNQDGALLREAFGQARVKAGQVDGGPPPTFLCSMSGTPFSCGTGGLGRLVGSAGAGGSRSRPSTNDRTILGCSGISGRTLRPAILKEGRQLSPGRSQRSSQLWPPHLRPAATIRCQIRSRLSHLNPSFGPYPTVAQHSISTFAPRASPSAPKAERAGFGPGKNSA